MIDQYNICRTGKRKLREKTNAQTKNAPNECFPLSKIFFFFLTPPLKGVWY